MGAGAFIQAAKSGATYTIYATSTLGQVQKSIQLPDQYKEFQDVFEKKNADTLS